MENYSLYDLRKRSSREDRSQSLGQYRIAVASGESPHMCDLMTIETHPTLPRFGTDLPNPSNRWSSTYPDDKFNPHFLHTIIQGIALMSILVTGGAGYIGSVMVELLREQQEQVVVLDDLFRGHRAAVDPAVPFYHGNTGDRDLVQKICAEHKIDACIHFAALAYVGESVTDPKLYFRNNVESGVALLDVLMDSGVRHFVFSSTCATYGEPISVPISEDHPQKPTNPYGMSKLMMEHILKAYDDAYGFKFVALRYFNASGATKNRGEDHEPESHLIPNVLAVALGKRDYVSVFGDKYPTPDGTAIRDYIHVTDLCSAHVLALEHLRKGGDSRFINLGNGQGYSVMEVIETARVVTNHEISTRIEPARAGDPSRLVANAELAKRVLNWKPQYPDLKSIVESAWTWHRSHPNGYEDH